ncbi:MAG: hypothetical protein Q8J76_06315, partial [Desulfobulbaceae bacterium]|nr:hypothetical protein [Desulfobulbaceae bacterium]
MALLNWLGMGKKGEKVTVVKVKEESIHQGEMASSSPSAAVAAMARIVDQKTATTKILVVEDGRTYSETVTEYALKMAQRLDCEIIALDTSVAPLKFTGERRDTETAAFFDTAERSVRRFAAKAEKMGITLSHMMELGDQEEVIARMSSQDAGIRYVLTEPEVS